MRKLKRIQNTQDIEPENNVKEALANRRRIRVSKKKRKVLKRSSGVTKIIKYPKKRCDFIEKDGTRCKNYAVGKGTLCKKHGGNPVVRENLRSDRELAEMSSLTIKFNPSIHPMAYITMSREGYSDTEIACEFGVSKSTIQAWAEKYESFFLATEIGKEMQEAWWLRVGKDNLENKRNFNTGLFKFLTMNKLGYSDKIEQKTMSTHVHGVLMIPDAMTEEEWEAEDVIDV